MTRPFGPAAEDGKQEETADANSETRPAARKRQADNDHGAEDFDQ
jgi:hypothetical protein